MRRLDLHSRVNLVKCAPRKGLIQLTDGMGLVEQAELAARALSEDSQAVFFKRVAQARADSRHNLLDEPMGDV